MLEVTPLEHIWFSSRYRVQAVLGTGSETTVYLAVDCSPERYGRRVVVKQFHHVVPANEMAYLALFTHINAKAVPGLHAAFYEGAAWHLVMEYIDGVTLAAYQTEWGGRLSLEEVLDIGVQLASVCDLLHEQDVLYLALHPGHVMRRSDGQIFLINFEQACSTVPCVFAGDRRYASPEVCVEGALVDGRSDIYSLGVLLHELLLGSVEMQSACVPVEHLPESLSPRYQRIRHLLIKMTDYDATKRPQSMIEIMRELARI